MKKQLFLILTLLCAMVQGAWAWDGNGTKDNPWLIKTTADLDYIAERVNSGARTYSGKYFKLCNDITYDNTKDNNYTPIGGHIDDKDRPFSGNFDGCGHTISGIRFSIYRNQTGLFGRTGKNAFIHDVILADTRIFAGYDVGGIVGYQYGGTVRNCTVEGTVTIGSRQSTGDHTALGSQVHNYGGIVGQSYGGKIEYCTSSVKLGPPSPNIGGDISKDMNYGGICGYSVGTLNWNLTVGAEIPAVRDGTYGAICGNRDARWGKLYNNYYNACTVAGTDNATNVGCHAADVTSSGAASITFTGNGTEGEPYLIHSYTRWRIFACYVNNGNELGSKHWKLTADIKAETMAGRSETNSFQGTFDGNGHTVTVDYKSETPGVAPFSHVKNATIKDLRVAGTINASTQYAGGIVGQSYGSLNLTGCCSSVTINSSVRGDGVHGGLVGMLNGTSNTINACVFDGSFATTNGTTTCGGFIGSAGSNPLTITNSLIKPNSVAEGMVSKTFVNGGTPTPTITGSYYSGTTNLPANQGEEIIYISTDLTALGTPTANYALVKVYGNGLVHDGKFYAAPVEISGSGSEVDPYIISNADEWNTFANYVNNGTNLSGKFVKLTNDISANMMVGISDANSFQGTFDGNGKTLSVSYDTSEAWTAPFRHVKNAVIKNLHVAGTITTSAQFAGGIVAESHGALTLTGCRSSVAISSSVSGDGTHGGLVSTLSGAGHTVTIDNCIFDGSFATTNGTTNCGGFIGWPVWNTPTIKNSLMKPGSVDAGMLNNTFARWHTTYQPTISNCYFIATDNLPIDQGTQAYASAPSDEISKQQTLADGNSYYVPCTVNFWTMYQYTGSAITIAPTVTAADGTVLTADMDYTTNYATVTEKGTYNLTVTGQGNYSGAKTIGFLVADDVNGESLTAGEYTIHDNVTIDWRIVISGDVIINIAEGVTLTAPKGFEVSTGNSLTINGPGALVINGCDANKPGIGAATVGTVTINGGQVTVTGGTGAAGIGSDNAAQPSGTLTLGWTNASSDFINCDSYSVSSITFGQRFALDGTTTIATADNIGGTKIVPRPIAGTEADPFIIGSEDDWNDFAAKVNSGISGGYNNKYVKLTADISVTTMVGSDADHTFRGIFDGDGHTLTVNYTTDERFAGPFRYTYGATIKNLKTAGTIRTSSINAGGVVGRNGTESLTLENVSSSVTINSTISGAAYHGGLVGYTIKASLTGCAFTGRLLGAESHHIGGLLGQKSDTGNSNVSFSNCLFAPTEITVSAAYSYPFAAGAYQLATIGNDCYYTTTVGGAQGIKVSNAVVEGEINKQVMAADGNNYYMLCTVSGVKGYKLNGGNDIPIESPTVTAADGTVLVAGSDFTFTPTTVNGEGSKTLTVSGNNALYIGDKSLTFFVGDYQGLTAESTTLSAGEYKVYDDVTIPERITISGDVTLILGAGKTFTATKGIELGKGNSLTINGDTDDTGILDISGCDDGKSGIGAAEAGVLTVNGGTLNIVGGRQAAAIGGDYQNTSCGTITINGGQVTAFGGSEEAAGIGPGAQPSENKASTSGMLTLGWTSATDFVYSSGYANNIGSTLTSISFAEGKTFVAEGEEAVATADNIGGNRIVPAISLADKGSNSELLTEYNEKQIAVVLNDRTLYADGDWNTLCLPFGMNISQFDGVEARTLTTASISGTTLNLTFSEPVDSIIAGTPYIIKYKRDDSYDETVNYDLINPAFSGVTIDNTDRSYDNDLSGNAQVRFLGTYASQSFDTEDKSILFLGSANTLYYPESGATIGAQRAYFKIGDGSALVKQLTAFNIDFGDGTETGISLTPDPSPVGEGSDNWYSIDGRRLSGKPAQSGIYINNGRKVVIK